MKGTYVVDARNTFALAIFMGSTPKTKYGTQDQDVTANGERKWAATVAVTYTPEPGRQPVSDSIKVTTYGTDPGQSLTPGQPVEFDGLRVGEANGGLWFTATGIRPAAPAIRPAKPDAA
jgi:hypothetical protein